MRRYNTDGKALVYNTLQAYLKASRASLKSQLAVAHQEGWTLAIKLVRGAYIKNDTRSAIHDTKADTDESYNGIVHDVLRGTDLGLDGETPPMKLFLAGHNPESVAKAWNLIQELSDQKKLKVLPDFGQLQGMADELGCRLLQRCEDLRNSSSAAVVPRVYKCLTWGSVHECMQFLVRRVVENSGGTDRMRDGRSEYLRELWRRLLRR